MSFCDFCSKDVTETCYKYDYMSMKLTSEHNVLL